MNYPADYIPMLVSPARAEELMKREAAIFDLCIRASAAHPSLTVHVTACRHAQELLALHDTESPADEWPRLSAEQLLCVHLDWLDRKLASLMHPATPMPTAPN